MALILGAIVGALLCARLILWRQIQPADVFEFDTAHFHCVEHIRPWYLVCAQQFVGS